MINLAIALNAGTPTIRNEITKYFSKNNWAYWHWVDDFWIVQVPNNYTPKTLYQALEVLPDIEESTLLIIDLPNYVKYWGKNNNDAWAWLNKIGRAE